MTMTQMTSDSERLTPSRHPLMLSVGVSTSPICGVRDYSRVVREAIERRGVEVVSRWLEARLPGAVESWNEARRWLVDLDGEIRELEPDWILWHYSVFSYGHRGLPTLVPRFARTLRASGVPVITVAHEYVYPFGTRGLRGALLATSQRGALPTVVRASRAVVVTTQERRLWFETRRWLPRRQIHALPVPSNLPRVDASRPTPLRASSPELVLGVFGFAAESVEPTPVAAALRLLRAGGIEAGLVLIGSPGEDSPQGTRWRQAARSEGVEDAISFTGLLSPLQLADALTELDVVLYVDTDGPSSRRTSLAAALAAGKPIVAYDGPATWRTAVEQDALIVVQANGDDLARELDLLAGSRELRTKLGAAAANFSATHQAPDVIAGALLDIVHEVSRSSGQR